MSNLKSQQINNKHEIVVDYDQRMTQSELIDYICSILKENYEIMSMGRKKYIKYKTSENNYKILLVANVTYLGGNGQHPIYKKRMQLKTWYKDVYNMYKDNPQIELKFIGLYSYSDVKIIVDFNVDDYINKKMNNSAAHVYTHDLYKGLESPAFKKVDSKGNTLHTLNALLMEDYLKGHIVSEEEIFSIFKEFNDIFEFGKELLAKKIIPVLYNNGWPNWKQGEWPGNYLEYLLNEHIKNHELSETMEYIGLEKDKNQLDFDLIIKDPLFFGDLKASSSDYNVAPGNKKESVLDAIHTHNRMWYIIYEHDTVKDSTENDYEATRFRTSFIKENGEWDPKKPFNELSYYKRMKYSVTFNRMFILEVNRANISSVLSDFKQGRQPDGSKRKVKFKINKRNIDNLIVYTYIKKE